MTTDASRKSLTRRNALRAGLLTGAGLFATSGAMASPAAAAAAAADVTAQGGWKWCHKCKGLFFTPGGPGICPNGGGHASVSSYYNYYLWIVNPSSPRPGLQSNWRWCRVCQALAHAGNGPGLCPYTGRHDHSQSGDYHLMHDDGAPFPGEQNGWRWCDKCQALFYGPNQASSWCPFSNDRHRVGSNTDYVLQIVTS